MAGDNQLDDGTFWLLLSGMTASVLMQVPKIEKYHFFCVGVLPTLGISVGCLQSVSRTVSFNGWQ